jgi:hypothetical protein
MAVAVPAPELLDWELESRLAQAAERAQSGLAPAEGNFRISAYESPGNLHKLATNPLSPSRAYPLHAEED